MSVAIGISLAIAGGSMALQYLLAPKVKPKPVDVGKQDDVRVTLSDYGAFIPKIFGKARTGGIIIWSSGVEHLVQTTSGGDGKGNAPQNVTRTHYYLTDLATLVCRGEVVDFLRMWRDQNLVLSSDLTQTTGTFEAEGATLSAGASIIVDGTASGGNYVDVPATETVTFDFSTLTPPVFPIGNDEIVTATTKVEFRYKCATDLPVTLTFDATPAFTEIFQAAATWTVKTVIVPTGFHDTLVYTYDLSDCPDIDVVTTTYWWDYVPTPGSGYYNRPTASVTGNVDQTIIYPTDPDDPSAYYNAPFPAVSNGKLVLNEPIPSSATRWYNGTTNQEQDSAIISWLDERYGTGEGNLRAPAFRNYAYIVNENRQLKRGAVENDTFEVNCGNATVNDVLEYVFDQVSLSSGYRTLTATSALTFIGFIEQTAQSRRQLVEYLERFFFFRIAEIDGTVQTILDSTTSVGTITADQMRAHEWGEEMPGFDAEVIIKDESELPREVRVSVLNPDLEYHNDSVPSSLFASLSANESKEYAFPIIEKGDTARNVAERLLLKEHSESQAIEFFGMPELAQYAVGDVITVPVNGASTNIRIERKQMVLPLGKIRFQGMTVAPFTATYYQDDPTALAIVPPAQFAVTTFPRNSVVIPILSLPVRTTHRARLGVYLAVCGRGRGQSENIGLYREQGTDNFVLETVVDVPAEAGLTSLITNLNSWASESEDTSSILDIEFFDDVTLESATAPDLAANPTLNLIRVGDEWIQYRTVAAQTLDDTSPYRSKWRLTNLTRGLFGTGIVTSHVVGEYAVNWTNAVRFYDLDAEYVGTSVTLKAVTAGQALENGLTTTFTFTPVKPFTVTNEADDYVLDANATTTDELADVVGTITNYINLS